MSYWNQFEEAPINDYWSQFEAEQPALHPMTEAQRASAAQLAQQIRPRTDKTLGDYMAQNVADMVYGADSALSGYTFGGYDWLKRKTGLGVNQDDYLAMKRYNDGSDIPARIAGTVAEIGGNIMGGGGALVKGLQNTGLRGLKLASAAGGVEGAAYGLTGSDRLTEISRNMALGAGYGALGGAFGEGIGRALGSGLRGIRYTLSRKPNKASGRALYGLTGQLAENTGNRLNAEKLVSNALNDAERTGRSLIEVADEPIVDIAQQARQKTPSAGYTLQNRLNQAREAQPAELRGFVNDVLGTSSRGNSVAEVTARAQAKARPIYQKLDNLGIQGLLKFKKMLAEMGIGNYRGAAKECLNSKYAKDVGKRAERIAKTIETGKFVI